MEAAASSLQEARQRRRRRESAGFIAATSRSQCSAASARRRVNNNNDNVLLLAPLKMYPKRLPVHLPHRCRRLLLLPRLLSALLFMLSLVSLLLLLLLPHHQLAGSQSQKVGWPALAEAAKFEVTNNQHAPSTTTNKEATTARPKRVDEEPRSRSGGGGYEKPLPPNVTDTPPSDQASHQARQANFSVELESQSSEFNGVSWQQIGDGQLVATIGGGGRRISQSPLHKFAYDTILGSSRQRKNDRRLKGGALGKQRGAEPSSSKLALSLTQYPQHTVVGGPTARTQFDDDVLSDERPEFPPIVVNSSAKNLLLFLNSPDSTTNENGFLDHNSIHQPIQLDRQLTTDENAFLSSGRQPLAVSDMFELANQDDRPTDLKYPARGLTASGTDSRRLDGQPQVVRLSAGSAPYEPPPPLPPPTTSANNNNYNHNNISSRPPFYFGGAFDNETADVTGFTEQHNSTTMAHNQSNELAAAAFGGINLDSLSYRHQQQQQQPHELWPLRMSPHHQQYFAATRTATTNTTAQRRRTGANHHQQQQQHEPIRPPTTTSNRHNVGRPQWTTTRDDGGVDGGSPKNRLLKPILLTGGVRVRSDLVLISGDRSGGNGSVPTLEGLAQSRNLSGSGGSPSSVGGQQFSRPPMQFDGPVELDPERASSFVPSRFVIGGDDGAFAEEAAAAVDAEELFESSPPVELQFGSGQDTLMAAAENSSADADDYGGSRRSASTFDTRSPYFVPPFESYPSASAATLEASLGSKQRDNDYADTDDDSSTANADRALAAGQTWLATSSTAATKLRTKNKSKPISTFKPTSASSAGVRVVAGGSKRLVINSRGLITAAKGGSKGATGQRPYRPPPHATAALLPSQMDHSLDPINRLALNGSSVVPSSNGGGDRNSSADRPAFLKNRHPAQGVPTIWVSNNLSTGYHHQQQHHHQLNRSSSSGNSSLPQGRPNSRFDLPAALGALAHEQQVDRFADRIYDQAVSSPASFTYDDEPSSLQQQQTIDKRHSWSANNITTKANSTIIASSAAASTAGGSASSFYHNPPYKQPHQPGLETNEPSSSPTLANATENYDRRTALTSSSASSATPTSTHKPVAKPGSNSSKQHPNNNRRPPNRQSLHVASSGSAAITTTTSSPSTAVQSGSATGSAAANASVQQQQSHHAGYELVHALAPAIALGATNSTQFSLLSTIYNTTSRPTTTKIRNKLQHMIIGKILKNQPSFNGTTGGATAGNGNGSNNWATPLGPPTNQLSALQSPLFGPSNLANNVASLLAHKLSSFVIKPPPSRGQQQQQPGSVASIGSGPLNSLFGGAGLNRPGSNSASALAATPGSKLKHRLTSPFITTAHSSINRRTAGVGSLLFSGFIYGLSVLPALMALTGINPLSSVAADDSTSSASSSTSSSAVVPSNRHGGSGGGSEAAAKRKKRPSAAAAGSAASLASLSSSLALAGSPPFTLLLPFEAATIEDDLPTTLATDPSVSSSSSLPSAANDLKSLYVPPPTIIEHNSLGSATDLHPILDEPSLLFETPVASTAPPTVYPSIEHHHHHQLSTPHRRRHSRRQNQQHQQPAAHHNPYSPQPLVGPSPTAGRWSLPVPNSSGATGSDTGGGRQHRDTSASWHRNNNNNNIDNKEHSTLSAANEMRPSFDDFVSSSATGEFVIGNFGAAVRQQPQQQQTANELHNKSPGFDSDQPTGLAPQPPRPGRGQQQQQPQPQPTVDSGGLRDFATPAAGDKRATSMPSAAPTATDARYYSPMSSANAGQLTTDQHQHQWQQQQQQRAPVKLASAFMGRNQAGDNQTGRDAMMYAHEHPSSAARLHQQQQLQPPQQQQQLAHYWPQYESHRFQQNSLTIEEPPPPPPQAALAVGAPAATRGNVAGVALDPFSSQASQPASADETMSPFNSLRYEDMSLRQRRTTPSQLELQQRQRQNFLAPAPIHSESFRPVLLTRPPSVGVSSGGSLQQADASLPTAGSSQRMNSIYTTNEPAAGRRPNLSGQQQQADNSEFQVGHIMNYTPISLARPAAGPRQSQNLAFPTTKHDSDRTAVDENQWRAIAPPPNRASGSYVHSQGQYGPLTGGQLQQHRVSPPAKYKGQQLGAGVTPRGHHHQQAAKKGKPRRRKSSTNKNQTRNKNKSSANSARDSPPVKRKRSTTTTEKPAASSSSLDTSESELILSHALAMGSRVLNEPF